MPFFRQSSVSWPAVNKNDNARLLGVGLLKFNMKIFVNVARLEIGQLFTPGTRRGHPCTLDTFLVYVILLNETLHCYRMGIFFSIFNINVALPARPHFSTPFNDTDNISYGAESETASISRMRVSGTIPAFGGIRGNLVMRSESHSRFRSAPYRRRRVPYA